MLIVLIAFTVLLLIGMPVAFAIGISGLLFFLQRADVVEDVPDLLVGEGLPEGGHPRPGDPVLEITDRDVALTREYQGRRRMTLTYPALARAEELLWLVSGADKHQALTRLLARDPAIPAGRVEAKHSTIFATAASVDAQTGTSATGDAS